MSGSNVTTDRTAIVQAIVARIMGMGHWDIRVRATINAQVVPPDLHAPFVLVFDLDTDYGEPKGGGTSRMVYDLGIGIYYDLDGVQETLQGVGEQQGIRWYQDLFRGEFNRGDLGGLVDMMWVGRAQPPEVVPVMKGDEFDAALVAVTSLRVTVERAG